MTAMPSVYGSTLLDDMAISDGPDKTYLSSLLAVSVSGPETGRTVVTRTLKILEK